MIGGAHARFRSEVEHFVLQKRCVEVFCRSRRSVGGLVTKRLMMPTKLLPFLLLEMMFRSMRTTLRRPRTVFITHDPISCLGFAGASLLFAKKAKTYLIVHGPMSLEQKWLSSGFLRKRLVGFLLATIERISYKIANQLFDQRTLQDFQMSELAGALQGVGSFGYDRQTSVEPQL